MLINLGKENDWEKHFINYKDNFGLYDFFEYFYHDRFEGKLNEIMKKEKN